MKYSNYSINKLIITKSISALLSLAILIGAIACSQDQPRSPGNTTPDIAPAPVTENQTPPPAPDPEGLEEVSSGIITDEDDVDIGEVV